MGHRDDAAAVGLDDVRLVHAGDLHVRLRELATLGRRGGRVRGSIGERTAGVIGHVISGVHLGFETESLTVIHHDVVVEALTHRVAIVELVHVVIVELVLEEVVVIPRLTELAAIESVGTHATECLGLDAVQEAVAVAKRVERRSGL